LPEEANIKKRYKFELMQRESCIMAMRYGRDVMAGNLLVIKRVVEQKKSKRVN
jgi:hypothetical protein